MPRRRKRKRDGRRGAKGKRGRSTPFPPETKSKSAICVKASQPVCNNNEDDDDEANHKKQNTKTKRRESKKRRARRCKNKQLGRCVIASLCCLRFVPISISRVLLNYPCNMGPPRWAFARESPQFAAMAVVGYGKQRTLKISVVGCICCWGAWDGMHRRIHRQTARTTPRRSIESGGVSSQAFSSPIRAVGRIAWDSSTTPTPPLSNHPPNRHKTQTPLGPDTLHATTTRRHQQQRQQQEQEQGSKKTTRRRRSSARALPPPRLRLHARARGGRLYRQRHREPAAGALAAAAATGAVGRSQHRPERPQQQQCRCVLCVCRWGSDDFDWIGVHGMITTI